MPSTDPKLVEQRRARIGAALLAGHSLASAIREEGLSNSVARRPAGNGYAADRCIQAAKAQSAHSDVETIRELASKAVLAGLAKGVTYQQALKTLEVAAKIGHGDQDREIPRSPEAIRARLELIEAYMARYRELTGRSYLKAATSSGRPALSPPDNASNAEKP